MSSTNKTTYYELSQYIGTDKPTYLGDYNADMLAIDTAIHNAADAATTAVNTANTANSTATTAANNASTALSTATSAAETATTAQTTAETASTNASAALTAASGAQTAAAANTITNLAPAYDSTLTYEVGDLVTYIDAQGSGKLYKCIVAVETAMDFNINYWDDVTASEVFTGKGVIATYTVDTANTITWGSVMNNLGSTLASLGIYRDIELRYDTSSRTTRFIQSAGNYNSSDIYAEFTRSEVSTTRMDILTFRVGSENSYGIEFTVSQADSSINFSNISSNYAPVGVYSIIKH